MHAFAYIDPGVGALIWQSIIGIFVGLLFYLRKTRKWIGAMMNKMFRTGEKTGNTTMDIPAAKSELEADHSS